MGGFDRTYGTVSELVCPECQSDLEVCASSKKSKYALVGKCPLCGFVATGDSIPGNVERPKGERSVSIDAAKLGRPATFEEVFAHINSHEVVFLHEGYVCVAKRGQENNPHRMHKRIGGGA